MTPDFSVIFSLSPNAYVLLDRDFTIRDMNEAYLRATMRRREQILDRNMFEAFPRGPHDPNGRSEARLRSSLERALLTGEVDHLPVIQFDIARPDGAGFEERFWSATHTPLRGKDGRVVLILQHTVDVTELHQLRRLTAGVRDPDRMAEAETGIISRAKAVDETNQQLDQERRHLRRLFEQAPGFMAVMRGPDHIFELANGAFVELVGRRDLVGKTVAEALPELADQGFPELLDEVYRSGKPYIGRSVPMMLAGGPDSRAREAYLDFVYQPILDAGETVTGIFVQGHDVTELKRAQEHQQLMINELNHRVKNSLAVVQAIAAQTLRGSEPLPVAREAFVERLIALARAHDLLIEENWDGADLREVVVSSLSTLGHPDSRVRLDGEGARIAPKTALSLAMALHELATNATKYGALSGDEGSVLVRWSIRNEAENRMLSLRWEERGGPTVSQPVRRGFGPRLIERGLAGELGGEARISYETGGVVCTVDAPLPPAG
jgi:PAS domain S-box-containing protein